jgi:hypothetical protein
LLEALVLLGTVAPLLKFGPAALTGRILRRLLGVPSRPADPQVVSGVAAAVTRAAAHVPFATCLARAVTAWLMVRRRHEGATLRLGVSRDGARGFMAHAWLECNGERVIGGELAQNFTAFPPFS